MSDLFWKRWVKQYLPELQNRQKWLHTCLNVSVRDLVLLREENVPWNIWPLVRVIKTYPNKDELVRSVKVKTMSAQLVRPIARLIMLEAKLY